MSLKEYENKVITYLRVKPGDKSQISVENEVKESIEFAENSELPSADELYKDVYQQEDYPYIKEYLA